MGNLKFLEICRGLSIEFWRNNHCIKEINNISSVLNIIYIPKYNLLVSTDVTNRMNIWSLNSFKCIKTIIVNSLALHYSEGLDSIFCGNKIPIMYSLNKGFSK